MPERFGYVPCGAEVAYAEQDYYLWDGSVVFAEGRYHMFCSRWPKELGFGWNWLFNSEIVHAVADHPQGRTVFCGSCCPAAAGNILTG